MADGGCNSYAENDVVELEAMCKDGFSWRPCQVSLCSSGLGLIVEYEHNHPKEVITDNQEVLSRIRVRSTPLKGDDCSYIQRGNHVLCIQSSHVKGVFCDAQVEKVVRVRHSQRIHCRCSFTIKWLHQPLEQAVTVPASSIMKLNTKSINLNPTISTYFRMLPESSNGVVDKLSCSTIVDKMNSEMDINALLEKQIEEISHFADVARSHKKISTDIVFGLQVDLKGQSRNTTNDASLKATCHNYNDLKGFTSNRETFAGSRLPLNPLAARAALASLRSKFPQNTEPSVEKNVDERDITSKNFSSTTNDLSRKVPATLVDLNSNFEDIVKTHVPTSNAPFADESSRTHAKGRVNKYNITTQPSETRFTRSRIQKNIGIHESTQKIEAAQNSTKNEKDFSEIDEKHNCPKRITRSAVGDETKKKSVQSEPKTESIERSKRVKTTPKTAEGDSGNSHGIRKKYASSVKQETRFSPRLRFLHRTRSRTKA